MLQIKKETYDRYKTGWMRNPPLDFLAGIARETSAKKSTSCGDADVTYILSAPSMSGVGLDTI